MSQNTLALAKEKHIIYSPTGIRKFKKVRNPSDLRMADFDIAAGVRPEDQIKLEFDSRSVSYGLIDTTRFARSGPRESALASKSSLRGSSSLSWAHSLIFLLIASSFNCTLCSDIVCCLLSELLLLALMVLSWPALSGCGASAPGHRYPQGRPYWPFRRDNRPALPEYAALYAAGRGGAQHRPGYPAGYGGDVHK